MLAKPRDDQDIIDAGHRRKPGALRRDPGNFSRGLRLALAESIKHIPVEGHNVGALDKQVPWLEPPGGNGGPRYWIMCGLVAGLTWPPRSWTTFLRIDYCYREHDDDPKAEMLGVRVLDLDPTGVSTGIRAS